MKLIEIKKGPYGESEALIFDTGHKVTYYHGQYCCEVVYADFDYLKDDIGKEFQDLSLEVVPDSGIRLGGNFIPCYNSQNGYYSDGLTLIITAPDGVEIHTDITEGNQDT